MPLLATKLKNQIHAIDPAITVALRNVAVNGRKMGCSGFITDPRTGRVVYINTDDNHGTNTRAYFRGARDTKDYTGGLNQFAGYDALAETAVHFLKMGDQRLWPKK
jgi:hypothetical protein